MSTAFPCRSERSAATTAATRSGATRAKTGPPKKYLEGLTYVTAEGFAPHPYFTEWVEAQIQTGFDELIQ